MGIDREAVLGELEPRWLDGLEGAERSEAAALLRELVDDWALEADATPNPDAVLAIQRSQLEAAADGGLDALRARVLTRRAEHLGAETFALGRAILAGTVDDQEARSHGRELLARAEALGPELRDGPEAARRELNDAVMEALYAVERKAMSPRLAREAGGGPPSIF